MVSFGDVKQVLVHDNDMEDYMLGESPLNCAADSPNAFQSSSSPCNASKLGFGHVGEASPEPCKRVTGPWLLGNENRALPRIMVKNTFIDCLETGEGEDEGVAVAKTKSCPVVRMPVPQAEDEEADGLEVLARRRKPRARTVQHIQAEVTSEDSSPAVVAEARERTESWLTATPSAQEACIDPFKMRTVPVVSFMKQDVAPQRQDIGQQEVVAPDVPEARRPLTSAGSSLHGSGECRPCAWFWRHQGCDNGEECRHCHLCPQGELKARRKSKMASIRKQDRPERVPLACEPRTSHTNRPRLGLASLV